jgi:adenylylsulfate kinase-like enzyme
MTQTVRQLLDDQAAGLVGRDDEMEILRQLLREAGPLVVFVHGIAGIGKSALADAFAVDARAHGAILLHLDGRWRARSGATWGPSRMPRFG